MRRRFFVRISDNVLDYEDFPVNEIFIRTDANCNIITTTRKIKRGVYSFPDMLGWTVNQLFKWIEYDSTGRHPEEYHDIGLYFAGRFYSCDSSFSKETIDNRWCVCHVCGKVTRHDDNDECIVCKNIENRRNNNG